MCGLNVEAVNIAIAAFNAAILKAPIKARIKLISLSHTLETPIYTDG